MSFEKFPTDMQTMFQRTLWELRYPKWLTQDQSSVPEISEYDSDSNQSLTPGFLWSGTSQHGNLQFYCQQFGGRGRKSRRSTPPPSKKTGKLTLVVKSPDSGVEEEGGAIFIGFYPNWFKFLDGEKQSSINKRENLSIKVGEKRRSSTQLYDYIVWGTIIQTRVAS